MNNKKGISTIVATVLIVLITVAAVTILWAAISPMIGQDIASKTACFDAQTAIKIDTNQQYTCRGDDKIDFRMSRESDNIELRGAEIYVELNGSTYSPITELDDTKIPGTNQVKKGDQLTIAGMNNESTVSIAIAPLLLIDGAEIPCEKSAPVTLNIC